MCGICGIAVPDRIRRRVDGGVLARMRDALVHRGPDGAGQFIDGSVGIAHRRLSIVDLGGGHQPMSAGACTQGPCANAWIVFNGEIYNHAELRRDMEARGHHYHSASDTETILHLYEEYGVKCVEQLRGMFAFAIWDATRRRLMLARDRLGIKPLYYTHSDAGVLHFASEIKALIEAGAVRPELNYDALPDYAANRAPMGDDTLFQGVRRLPPGHTLVWEEGRLQIEPFWELSYAKEAEPQSDDEYVARFGELFREAVRLRLMADVPLGMFLSGGIDSSAIAAVMSQLVPEPIKTFSVAFAEREANELEYARTVARAFKTDHHEIVVSPEEFFAALPELVYHEDEPIAHPSSVALNFVSRLAGRHVKVVLTGEGSDELLAGYNKYRATVFNLAFGQAYELSLPAPLRRAVQQTIESLGRQSRAGRKLARTFLCVPPRIEDIYFDNFAVFSRARQQRLFSAKAREQMAQGDPYGAVRAHLDATDAGSLLDRLLAADMKTYLHELLMKQDQMSMAASIESRVPFLDHKLVEFAAALPARMKLRGWTTKHILRRAMQGVLPPEILTRKKMGFPVPVGKWLRGPYRHLLDEYLLSARAKDRGLFAPDYVAELVARHTAGEDHTERLWSLINFEIWQRRFFDGEEHRTGSGSDQVCSELPDLSTHPIATHREKNYAHTLVKN